MNDSSQSTDSSVRDFYDGFAPAYERSRISTPYSALIGHMDRGVVFDQAIPGTALEVGPGSGRITERLIRRGIEVTVTDLSTGMLDLIKARFPDVQRVAFPFESLDGVPGYGTFDNAVAMRVLSHVPDPAGAIHALAGAVRPGGRVIFDMWNKWGYVGLSRRLKIKKSKVLTTFQSHREMRRMITNAGLEIRFERGIGFGPIPPYALELFGRTSLRRLAHMLVFVCQRPG